MRDFDLDQIAYPGKKPLMPEDPVDRAHVRYAIDHVSKNIIPNWFKLLQAQDGGEQDKARSCKCIYVLPDMKSD